jgi:pimeloyl-ACP methyl ester carboxylesterase
LYVRGYGETDKPAGKENYTMEILKEDIVQLIKEVNPSKKCILVAHDWGGVIAWPVVQEHPELFEKFIVMNSPHGKVMAKAVRNGLKQLFKSWYVFMFQCPYLPEWLLSINDYEFIRDIYKSKTNGLVNEGNFTEDDVEAYKYTFGQEGALTPPINYYRCAFSGQPRKPFKLIDTPTLLLWGADDVALDISLAEGHKDICTDISVKVINDCSHWVQQDCPETVNEYMKEFLEE